MNFAILHYQNKPLLIANVWDVGSAMAAQQAGYLALGTSSAAIATMLGYDDGEVIPFSELLYIVRRIKSACDLPLTVDLESGFGETASEIAVNIKYLVRLGVVGINLEDSKVVNGTRLIEDAVFFADKLTALRSILIAENVQLFLNVRTDTFLLNLENALQETLYRGQLYKQSGADGFFVPCVTGKKEIEAISSQISLPLNVMCMPELPDFNILAELGVSRISMGNFIHSQIQQQLNKSMSLIQSQQSFAGVFCDENY